ncbi:SDR family NAD(P)-dependent oxidoreductase [Solicola gregarius]|uniref:SDR family NAD(P)-dependent oxidoreductase n=1 Tax=Solicola gregarius TaxID=2908642 RepID=A0AA46YN73_9ACTN|nr:SDR family NAD(P)-dependent oxidoreductase [Solicola gregarius]UYM06448.1 SDR family NAD(P)-dependent oxidoreductase [Solicola gregarius]
MTKEHGVEASYVQADLTIRADVDRVAERLADPANPVDVLVNNAGYGLMTKFADSTIDDEQGNLDILVGAPMRLSHATIGPMLERRRGRIINIASVAGYTPRGTYGAHKAWLISFSRWANLEYAHRGVTTTAVVAGFVRTEFHQRMDARTDNIPGWMWLSADRLVREALADVDAGKALSTPSKRYKVLSVLARNAPQSIVAKAARKGREAKPDA